LFTKGKRSKPLPAQLASTMRCWCGVSVNMMIESNTVKIYNLLMCLIITPFGNREPGLLGLSVQAHQKVVLFAGTSRASSHLMFGAPVYCFLFEILSWTFANNILLVMKNQLHLARCLLTTLLVLLSLWSRNMYSLQIKASRWWLWRPTSLEHSWHLTWCPRRGQ